MNIFYQISHAVGYLHDKNIAHRDIKMENILLDPHGNVKLIDFGFSIKVPKTKKLNIFCGTPSYMSPEIVSKVSKLFKLIRLHMYHLVLMYGL